MGCGQSAINVLWSQQHCADDHTQKNLRKEDVLVVVAL